MILIDQGLDKRQAAGDPIKVAMVGAGFMGRGIALQTIKHTPGMEMVAISNRNLENAKRAYREADILEVRTVDSVQELEDAINAGRFAVTEDAMLLCQAEGIDAIVEVSGDVKFAASVALEAIRNHKHFITMSVEMDGTVGPILKIYADKAGVVFTSSDGDQPGVTMNLYRFVKGIGIKPVLCGNIKGLHDRYRNPTTQEGFAKKWRQNVEMITSFADGTKLSFEQAITANATGMLVGQRGMCGPTVETGTPIEKTMHLFPQKDMLSGPGIVDYVVGAVPSPGVFVIGTTDSPHQQFYMHHLKMGEGPFYCFYRPYHLCHFEVPSSVARAVLHQDATIAPIGPPCVDVVTTAKIDLESGQVLDGLGGYMTYGLCENTSTTEEEGLLPLGVAEGCRLKRPVAKDQVLTYADVDMPSDRLIDRLRIEQKAYFFGKQEFSK